MLVMALLMAWLIVGTLPAVAQGGVRALVVNEAANIRITPAIGAQVIASVTGGYVFEVVTGRSADSQWIRVEFNGDEGWVNLAPLLVLEGDITSLPVGDPRTIPYGGFEAPRAGSTAQDSLNKVRVTNGLRMRAGPGQGYPTIGNLYARTVVPAFGRTRSNGWVQVAYNGILGWVSSQFLEFLETPITALPIDGIVADSPPIIDDTGNEYFDVLKLFLSRIDLAQPSLDNMRGKWTDAALNGFAVCRDYPARPSDYIVPQPILAANYGILFPIQEEFNQAMGNLRQAIDMFIEICDQPGTTNLVGEGAASNALGLIAVIDQDFADLRRKLNELIPDLTVGPDECLLIFRNRAEVLPLIQPNQIIRTEIKPNDRALGFCFDAPPGLTLSFQILRLSGNASPFIAISPFDNPTNFLVAQQSSSLGELTLVPPFVLMDGGRFLILIYDAGGQEPPAGEIALALTFVSNGVSPLLVYNKDTDTLSLSGIGVGVTSTPFGNNTSNNPNNTGGGVVTCPSSTYTCDQLFTCQEAYACLAAGNLGLDPDGNGKPCPNLCGP
jgi:uncharacterized protein YraI